MYMSLCHIVFPFFFCLFKCIRNLIESVLCINADRFRLFLSYSNRQKVLKTQMISNNLENKVYYWELDMKEK
jgi:hypothetical protein